MKSSTGKITRFQRKCPFTIVRHCIAWSWAKLYIAGNFSLEFGHSRRPSGCREVAWQCVHTWTIFEWVLIESLQSNELDDLSIKITRIFRPFCFKFCQHVFSIKRWSSVEKSQCKLETWCHWAFNRIFIFFRLLKLQRTIVSASTALTFFFSSKWNFKIDKFRSLNQLLLPSDR